MTEINFANLKKAVKELNEKAVEGVDKIRTVGINQYDMAIQYIKGCNAANDKDESILSDFMVEVYNSLPTGEELSAMKEKSKEEKPPKEKKEKKEKAPKEKKEPKPRRNPHEGAARSRYYHLQNAKSGKLDDMLFAGATVQELMDGCEVTKTRAIGHANHLVNDLGLTLVVKENKENPLLVHYKVKEEKWTPPETPAEKKEETKE